MRLQCYCRSSPHIWSVAYSSRPIDFISVVHTAVITAHYLPVERVGQQQPYHNAATGASRVQRSTGTLKMADAGEPSSLADAPVLYRAVRGEIRVDARKSLNTEMERFEPNTVCKVLFFTASNIRSKVVFAEYYMNIYHAKERV